MKSHVIDRLRSGDLTHWLLPDFSQLKGPEMPHGSRWSQPAALVFMGGSITFLANSANGQGNLMRGKSPQT